MNAANPEGTSSAPFGGAWHRTRRTQRSERATPSASASHPFSKTSATVKSGTTTLATFTAPAAPSYNDKITKNSAYNRDWRFGP